MGVFLKNTVEHATEIIGDLTSTDRVSGLQEVLNLGIISQHFLESITDQDIVVRNSSTNDIPSLRRIPKPSSTGTPKDGCPLVPSFIYKDLVEDGGTRGDAHCSNGIGVQKLSQWQVAAVCAQNLHL